MRRSLLARQTGRGRGCRPAGARIFIPAYPALPRWANLWPRLQRWSNVLPPIVVRLMNSRLSKYEALVVFHAVLLQEQNIFFFAAFISRRGKLFAPWFSAA